ncbi:Cell wall beta-glucan synthesis [Penicillium cf. griseofulvum]|uniref:Cell wall beta-glucan synthesis n=1 Tax=Penicillium cf. griseofulvum TaxID=2972120 RepID=A0A9W9MZI7_9EURO|nr:Cell wall beta-glucan synthesis [Penicillium cf. griseofulvum]KAJ5421391.1 Cell wall beta-glucan synthesis [Penicillium cf. griseofulvum]KAJ5424622.1 Cell wall beta-glucan synthesis [Penicillium cf. griseofulvum]
MYFSKSIVAVMASLMTLGLAADRLSFTSWPREPLEAGKPVTLTWIGADANQPVTILLRQGSSGDLQDVKLVTTDARDGTFTWTPDNDVKSGKTYAFQIRQKDQSNYTALLKSAGQPVADTHEAKDTTERKDATFETGTSAGTTAAGATTGTTGTNAALNAQTTDGTTHATQGTHTMTSTTSKDLISSSANLSGSPSSSSAASSTERMMASGTEVVNGKEASSTGSMQNGAASIPQYPVQLIIGIASLLAYLV